MCIFVYFLWQFLSLSNIYFNIIMIHEKYKIYKRKIPRRICPMDMVLDWWQPLEVYRLVYLLWVWVHWWRCRSTKQQYGDEYFVSGNLGLYWIAINKIPEIMLMLMCVKTTLLLNCKCEMTCFVDTKKYIYINAKKIEKKF